MLNPHLNRQLLTWTPLSHEIHADNVRAGWWTDLLTGRTLVGADELGRDRRNVGELLMLVVSELAEACDGFVGRLMDDKLPHRQMIEVELADAAIRIWDIGGAHRLDFTRTALQLLGQTLVPRLMIGDEHVEENLMSITCQVARAMESHRKACAADATLPHRSGFEVSLTLALILICELAHILGLDVDGAVKEKRAFNARRADHKIENRVAEGGKRY